MERQAATEREVPVNKGVHAGMPLGEVARQGGDEDLLGFPPRRRLPIVLSNAVRENGSPPAAFVAACYQMVCA